MKKIFIMGFLLLGVFLLNGCSLIEKIEIEEYQAYLENKYGEDKGFYMVEEKTCNWFELGTCSYLFSSSELNGKTFQITGEVTKGTNIFTDTYIGAKYDDRLGTYYKNLLGGLLNFNYTIQFVPNYKNIDSKITFEEYLKYEDLNLSIIINTFDENINIQSLQTSVRNTIKNNQIKNIEVISIQVDNCSDENEYGCNNYYELYTR